MIDLKRHGPRDFAIETEDPLEFEAKVHGLLAAAKRIALDARWEGDISEGPYLSALPGKDGAVDLVVAWKQSNNGTTFIAAEALFAHLGIPSVQGR